MRRLGALLALLAMSWQTAALAEQCARPGASGAASLSGVVDTYFPATASASAGATTISLGAGTGALTGIAAGDMLLVIQMQGASINATNSSAYGNGSSADTYAQGYSAIGQTGIYEFVRAASAVSVAGGSVTIVGGAGGGLLNSYVHAAATATEGQKRFQVIRVPQYTNASVTGTVSAMAWNGTTGGVLALDVADRLTFAGGSLNASGLGFRGGGARQLSGPGSSTSTDYRVAATDPANGAKAEGIAGTPMYVNNGGALLDTGVDGYPNGSQGRGAPGNAGGGGTDGTPADNQENTGGGGGGNGGMGGLGGYAWCPTYTTSCPQTGGHPGAAAPNGVTRLMMGGGGGAGTTNNGTGTPGSGFASSGAAGGGIVLLRVGEIAGAGTITANGASANTTVDNDANGGGGAGGTVLVSVLRNAGGGSISAQASGGNGGSNTGGGAPHGPGGGGGGGYVASNGVAAVSATVSGGAAGTTATGGFAGGLNYGALAGAAGGTGSISASAIPGVSAGAECTPTVTKSFATSPVSPGTPSKMNVTVTNNNPDLALTALAFTDTYPAGLVNATILNTAKSCTGAATLGATAGVGSFAVSAGTIAAASACTYSVDTVATSAGAKTNTIAMGGVTASYGAVSVASLEAASATIQVSAPLTITKVSQVYSDPVNGLANAKEIPGSYVYYTVTVGNPSGVAVTSDSIVVMDATPANLRLYTAVIPGGSGPIIFTGGTSGITFTYAGLASMTDDIDFSNNGGATWTYVPTPGADGTDAAVTNFRVRPKGTMAAGSTFTFYFGYMVL